eukprot:scaffold221676_cov31-Tisochrysis_lutea.AAC.3
MSPRHACRRCWSPVRRELRAYGVAEHVLGERRDCAIRLPAPKSGLSHPSHRVAHNAVRHKAQSGVLGRLCNTTALARDPGYGSGWPEILLTPTGAHVGTTTPTLGTSDRCASPRHPLCSRSRLL